MEVPELLPNPDWLGKATWVEVKAQVSKKSKLPPHDEATIAKMVSAPLPEVDDMFQALYIPRTKSDLSIRRTRFTDMVYHHRRLKTTTTLMSILRHIPKGFDYITVYNLTAAAEVLGIEWFTRMVWLGALDHDITHFAKVTSEMNNIIKSRGMDTEDWTKYVECKNLTGYRNPPFPGFDYMAEGKRLAQGGEEHNLYGYNWDELVKEFLPMHIHPLHEYRTFETFVMDGDWATAGSSSDGRIQVLIDGKIFKFKAKKNLAIDVLDLKKLVIDAINNDRQENESIIKSELGKLRIAVASDLKTYLQMAWVNELLNGSYKDWPGSTIEEDVNEQTKRMKDMLNAAAKFYGLPFDYDEFDHQPETDEIVGIIKHILRHARFNVPTKDLDLFDKIAANIVKGFYDAWFTVKDDKGNKEKVRVEGGVMSGLRWTTLLGNAWNTIMTGIAKRVVNNLGVQINPAPGYIRGDDSAIYAQTWQEAAAIKLGYDMCNVRAGYGKFSIQKGAMEFLRVWYSDRCYGYPARAIPGLTQRKPWTPHPWEEEQTMRAIFETVKTLRRRSGPTVDKLWLSYKQRWSSLHNLPIQALSAPIHLGGFGIEPAQPLYQIVPPVPRVPRDIARVSNATDWRQNKTKQKYLEKYGLVIGQEDADRIAEEERNKTMSSDDIPQVSSAYRAKWKDMVKLNKCKAIQIPMYKPPNTSFTIPLDPTDEYNIEYTNNRLAAGSPLFGSLPELKTLLSDRSALRTKMSVSEWIERYQPYYWGIIKTKFHRSWHLSEKIDYLTGDMPLQTGLIHSALNKTLGLMVASQIQPRSRVDRNSTFAFSAWMENILAVTNISQKLYWW